MHRALLLVLALPLLSACGGGNAPAPAAQTPAAQTQAPVAVNAPQAPAPATKAVALPVGAQPLLGSWSSDLANCGDQNTVTMSNAQFSGAGRQCQVVLTDKGDGSFALSCGQESIAMTPIFAPTGEGINIVWGDGKKQTVLRCSR